MLAVRRATSCDKEFIWRVHTSAIREICKTHYTEREIEAWVMPLRPGSYEWPIHNGEFYVAEKDGEVVGFGQVSQTQVEAIYVSPKHLRNGVGKLILQTLEERAVDLGAGYLEVLSSLNAVSFYERAGYHSLGPATYMLRPGISIAYVRMSKSLNKQQEDTFCR